MKANKKTLLSSLAYDGWKIFGVFALISGVLAFAYNEKDRLRENEILDIFLEGESKDLSFQKPLFEAVPNQEIKAVHLSAFSPNDSQFNVIANSYISSVSDIYLLGETLLNSHKEYSSYAKEISSENEESILSLSTSLVFYSTQGGQKKGVKVFDGEDASYNEGKSFASWFNLQETTYLLVSDVSSNRNSLDDGGQSLLWSYAYAFLRLGLC